MFQNSNEAQCPIYMIVRDNTAFTLEVDRSEFSVTLTATAASTMDTYKYIATATAEGGAQGAIDQTFWVTMVCNAFENTNAQKEFVYEVPATGQRVETFP